MKKSRSNLRFGLFVGLLATIAWALSVIQNGVLIGSLIVSTTLVFGSILIVFLIKYVEPWIENR